jgi:hypothetical protein
MTKNPQSALSKFRQNSAKNRITITDIPLEAHILQLSSGLFKMSVG